jgi:hypothetical protein
LTLSVSRLDWEAGREQWSFESPSSGAIQSFRVGEFDGVTVITYSRRAVGIEADTGEVLWERTFDSNVALVPGQTARAILRHGEVAESIRSTDGSTLASWAVEGTPVRSFRCGHEICLALLERPPKPVPTSPISLNTVRLLEGTTEELATTSRIIFARTTFKGDKVFTEGDAGPRVIDLTTGRQVFARRSEPGYSALLSVSHVLFATTTTSRLMDSLEVEYIALDEETDSSPIFFAPKATTLTSATPVDGAQFALMSSNGMLYLFDSESRRLRAILNGPAESGGSCELVRATSELVWTLCVEGQRTVVRALKWREVH